MDTGATASQWYYAKQPAPSGGIPPQQAGPFTWEQLYQQAQTGAFGPGDLIWNSQLPQWTPAGQIPGLFPAEPASATPPAVAAATPQPRPRKSILPWLIPLVALIVVGAGLGAYFGFFYDRDGDGQTTTAGNGTGTTGAATSTTGAATSTTGAATADQPPLVDTVPAVPTILDVRAKLTSFSVTPGGGTTTDPKGLVVVVPAGAVSSETDIEIRTLAGPYQMEEGTEPTGPNAAVCVGPTYDFGPEGLTFDKPVTITLPYDEAALPAGVSEEDVAFAYWNGKEWIAHAGLVDTANNTVTVQLARFDGLINTTVAGVIVVGGIILYTGKYIWDKLNDPERVNSDAILEGKASDWIDHDDPTVESFAESAVVRVPGDENEPAGSSAPLASPSALGQLLENNSAKRPLIAFPGRSGESDALDLRGRWSKDPSTNWQKPADYLTKNDLKGDCTDVSNALVSILANQGYHAKAVFGYVGDKNSPHVWVEVLVGDKPYFVDENGQFSPLTDEELGKAQLIRADPSDPRSAMWDENGQKPYSADWWTEYLKVDLNGMWTGTLTFTDLKLSPEAQAELDKLAENPPEEMEGCDLSSLGAILEQLKGKPCPMNLDITTQEGGTGTAVLFIDFSSLGEVAEPQEPAQVPLTWKDSTITISSTEDGQAVTITGTAVKSGDRDVMNGTMTIVASQEGQMIYTLSGEWQTTKQADGGASW